MKEVKEKKREIVNVYNQLGFIRTINDDEDIDQGLIENEEQHVSESENEMDQSVGKSKKKLSMNSNSFFAENFHQQNVWETLKEKGKNLYIDLSGIKSEENKGDDNSQSYPNLNLSSEKKDHLREKKNKTKGSKLENAVEENFENDHMFSSDDTSFLMMNLSRPLQKAIQAINYIHPTRIQASTIPVALLGRDIYACAATGTGKTAAFMLPVLERLLFKPKSKPLTRVLVLVPTRELAVQVFQVSQQLAQFTQIEVILATGGLDVKSQEAALRRMPDIVIATPGRLIDHLQNTPSFTLQSIEVLILDEADRMLDEFFASQMKEIIDQCAPRRQTMLFSATMTEEVKDLAAVSLNNPVKLFTNSNTDVAWNLRQEFIRIRPHRECDREAVLAALVCRNFGQRTMVFVQTKKQVHRLNLLLRLLGILSEELHGNLNQIKRLEALRKFQEEEANVLVATDVAARGLDIKDVRTVINFTMPNTIQHYIHRVGRTARAGRGGKAISLIGESERKMLKDILKKTRNIIKQRVIPQEVILEFQNKINGLEDQVSQSLINEKVDAALESSENQIKRAKGMMDGRANQVNQKRSWFQTSKERRETEKTMRLTPKITKKDKGKKTRSEDQATDRVSRELEKVAQYQARFVKRSQKPKRIRAINEPADASPKPMKKKKSNFEDELVNTKRQSVKKFRYMSKEKKFPPKNNSKRKNRK